MLQFNKSGKISKNKQWEFEVWLFKSWISLFKIDIYLSRKTDHAGFKFEVELLSIFHFSFDISDNRHWNYDEDRWYEYASDGTAT